MRHKRHFWGGYSAGIVISITAIVWGITNMGKLLAPSDKLAEIELINLQGQAVDIGNYQDKPMIVNYWATWCKPCVAEFPDFELIKQQYGNRVHFVMISDESIEKVNPFVEKNGYSFDFLLSRKPLQDFEINLRPVTNIYSAKGKLLNKQAGQLKPEKLKEWIEDALRNP